MKSQFSTSWLSSKQPRKQRKYVSNAPLHLRHNFLSAHLSQDLRKKYGKRSLPVRKGDEVLVMRGSHKKKKAKITQVDIKSGIVYLEGIQKKKRDGTSVNIPFSSTSLLLQSLVLEDKKRSIQVDQKNQTQGKSKGESKNASN